MMMPPKRYISIVLIVLIFMASIGVTRAQDDVPLAAPPDADLPLDSLAYEADFATEAQWQQGLYEDESLTWEAVPEGLQMVSPPEGPARYAPGTPYTATNFYVEMSFTPISCASDEAAILLNVRSDPTQPTPVTATSYVFVVQCDGVYRSRPVNNGNPGIIDFNGQLESPLVMGEVIHLGVLLTGRLVTWYMDGALIGTYFGSTTPNAGQFALGAEVGLTTIVHSLRVWSLEGDDAPSGSESASTAESENPLFTLRQARNIVVENFESPVFVTDMRSALNAYRTNELLIAATNQPTVTHIMADAPDANSYRIYYVEVSFQPRQCGGGFGLALGDAYSIIIQCNGTFAAYQNDANVLQTSFDGLDEFGRGHTVGAVVDGDTVYTYFDSQLAGSFNAPGANEQPIGLTWRTSESNWMEVGISRFVIVELIAP